LQEGSPFYEENQMQSIVGVKRRDGTTSTASIKKAKVPVMTGFRMLKKGCFDKKCG